MTRARITQIMNLLNLPPWKQEELLFLEVGSSRAGVTERQFRITSNEAWCGWPKQVAPQKIGKHVRCRIIQGSLNSSGRSEQPAVSKSDPETGTPASKAKILDICL